MLVQQIHSLLLPQGVVQQAYVIGLPNSTIVPYNLQDIVDIQCDALPAPPAAGRSCAQPRQSLQALLDGLTAVTEVSITSFIRNIVLQLRSNL